MAQAIWEFSSEGWKEGVRQFAVSGVKSVASAAAGALTAYLLSKIGYLETHMSITDHYFAYEAAFAIVARAAVSGFVEWVNTYVSEPSSIEAQPAV